MNEWNEAQKFEKAWWNTCQNTVWEDVKQMNLAKYLGLKIVPNEYTEYRIPLKGQKILDIGSGPSSLLLKCEDYSPLSAVLDPCNYPDWVWHRYEEAGLEYWKIRGEVVGDFFKKGEFDEVWIYNCLQHTENPNKIIRNAQRVGKIIRLFEWINTGTNAGHPHSFTQEWFEDKLHGEGKVVNLNSNGLYGEAFYGIFLGDSYDKETKEKI